MLFQKYFEKTNREVLLLIFMTTTSLMKHVDKTKISFHGKEKKREEMKSGR